MNAARQQILICYRRRGGVSRSVVDHLPLAVVVV